MPRYTARKTDGRSRELSKQREAQTSGVRTDYGITGKVTCEGYRDDS